MNIPISLTLLRLMLAPLAMLPVLARWDNGWFISAVIVAFAGITDALDGYLARRTGRVTRLGAAVDLITDKVFIGLMLLTLYWVEIIPVWIPAIVILREAVVAAVRLASPEPLNPDAWGKTKTAVSFIAITLILLHQDFMTGGATTAMRSNFPVGQILSLAGWSIIVAVALTIFSGINYIAAYIKNTGDKTRIRGKFDALTGQNRR